MKRAAVTLSVACVAFASAAHGQPEPAPAEPPAGEQPAPAAEPEPAPAEPTPPAPAAAPADAPPPEPGAAPPSHYYVEPDSPSAPPAAAPPAQGEPVYEPPPPGYGPPGQYAIYEPPPPPKPKHNSPKTALWLGLRLGWFAPFGDLWGQCVRTTIGTACDVVSWRDYASSGPMFELNVGARIGRRNMLFLLWERAALGTGREPIDRSNGGQKFGFSDFYALGVRFSTNPNAVGFVAEFALGWRNFTARWEDGTELDLTGAPLEARIGLGADIRLAPIFSISPMVTIGGGAFTDADISGPNPDGVPTRTDSDENAGHGWVTVQIGGHFDVFGKM